MFIFEDPDIRESCPKLFASACPNELRVLTMLSY